MLKELNNNSSLREEIHSFVYTHNIEYGKCEECEYRTDRIIKLIEEQINAKISAIQKDRLENKRLDFEGDSNLESQIEMLIDWKGEILQ